MSIPKVGTQKEGLVFYLWARNFRPFLEIESDMVDDIQQELRCIALEIETMTFEEQTVYQVIQKKIYRFIRNYGFRRPRGAKFYIANTTSLQIVADSLLN